MRAAAADLGLAIGLYQPFRDVEAMPEDRFRASLRRAEHKFAVMEALGADLLLVCSNVDADAIDDDALAADAAPRRSPSAPPTTASGSRTRRSPGAGTCTTTRTRGGSSRPRTTRRSGRAWTPSTSSRAARTRAGIRAIPGEKVFYLQLADAPRLAMDVLPWSRHYRCFPGQGDFDLAGFVAHVLATGYDGPLSLEVFNDVFRQADPGRMAVDAMRSLLLLEEATGVAQLTAAAPLPGYAFVELAVAPPTPPRSSGC